MNNEQANSIQIRIATETWEKERIYQFRYNIFVEEMSKQCPVDHQNKQMRDDLDEKSILLYAECESEIVGTSRITIAKPDDFPKWLSNIFALQKFKDMLGINSEIGFSTKVAIAPAYRGSTVMYQLIAEHFKIFQQNNIIVSFSGSNPHLIPMYERIGYRRFTTNFSEPGHGLLIPFVIILDDLDYLKAVHSPLYRLIDKKPHKSIVNESFRQVFPDTKHYINTQLVRKEDLWTHLQTTFDGTTQTDINLLSKLTEKERLSFFKLGAIFSCTKGDCLLSFNEVSNGVYFLLSGSIVAESRKEAKLLQPGQYFGNGLVYQKPSSQQITALKLSEVFIIPRQAFDKYKQLHPTTAAKIINGIDNAEKAELSHQYQNSPNFMEESI
ncbi:hypothetical protein SPFL3102_02577 [Sporomusaceae bacterium FL31]|nr:hypothetical protein SPFL3101_02007 [Sporomusaceae bacterium FL31]GCE34751.1 hypothetical protein SPFL3102_02577 [Sporomusaceae bacterium]